MRAGWNAEAMDRNAYHIAEDLNGDDDASTYLHSDSFMLELRIEVFQGVKSDEGAQSGHRGPDRQASLILETSWYHVGQIGTESSSADAPNTATTRTTRNTSDELSWDRAKARSLAGGTAIYLVLNRRDFAYNIQELIERIGHETVVENLNNAVMNRVDKKLPSSEEPEFVWTVLCQAMTQKSVRKADASWTEQDSRGNG